MMNHQDLFGGAIAASKFNLKNLQVIVDKNNFQQTGSTQNNTKDIGSRFKIWLEC